MTDNNITPDQLPMKFAAKYLGARKAQGLWGIKHTRRPVDELVASAKHSPTQPPPPVEILITTDGLLITHVGDKVVQPIKYAIDAISYGVQDVTFTRVFCMIICSSPSAIGEENLFMCHAFACESKHTARQLTFALSAAFRHFADKVRADEKASALIKTIDLRTHDQIDESCETDA